MKKLFIIFLMSLLVCSCERVFHPADSSLADITSYEELLYATRGVYGRMAELVYPRWGQGKLITPNYKGDDLTARNSDMTYFYTNWECDLSDERSYPYMDYYEGESINLWNNLYLVLVSANNILTQFTEPELEEEQSRYLLGEVYLIRAYCHFRLTRSFGRIPIVTDCEVKNDVPLSSYEEIYTSIEKDLIMASKLLPERASEARTPYVSPHKGSAKVILAEVYLSWAGYPALNTAMYPRAAGIAGNLIDSAEHYDLGLLSDFKDIWKRDPYLNTEVAFAISFSEPENVVSLEQTNQMYMGSGPTPWSPRYFLGPDTVGILYDQFSCEINFFNKFPKSYRKENTFLTRVYVPGSHFVAGVDTGYVEFNHWEHCSRPMYQKFILDSISFDPMLLEDMWWYWDTRLIFGPSHFYLFRYAHTLLTYAEAKARMGEADATAYDAINMIRRRANHVDLYAPSEFDLVPGLSPQAFADSVVWERAWELAGEPEGRWFDLLRLDMVKDLPQLQHVYERDTRLITENQYFYPIPEEEISLNPLLEE